ncbi:MAG: uroporphyrinogen-III C-methyltransferase [Deltaproteobacteria bacterium]|nr:uroporphyrinogen-III C-methyltransferase [Deltaproteobacteria bacterium]
MPYSDDEQTTGIVYLVGSGPGDPGLLTLKAAEKIAEADVIVYDYLAGHNFVQKAKPSAELIYVGKSGKQHTVEQIDINQILVKKAREGKTVVRLKGGDPYVFGRGGEEAEELAAAGISFEVVPGITSAIAAPAYAGIPVTHRDHASSVTFVTGHEDPTKEESSIDWSVLARSSGTLVFLMGVKNLDSISGELISNGMAPDTPAALVRWGTTPNQVSVKSDLSNIGRECRKRGLTAPAVLIVGSVVNLSDTLSWYERKPLFGKRIVVTRAREQSRKMAEKISANGGEPILFPTIEITDPGDYQLLDDAIERISEFDWILFTSENGVERFFKRFFALDKDIRELAGPRFGAIGPVTAKAISSRGIKVDRLAKEFVAEGLLDVFQNEDLTGKRFLIPRAEKARDVLPEGLEKKGAVVEITPVYQTRRPSGSDVDAIKKSFLKKSIAAITFTSSSTVNHFVDMFEGSNVRDLLEGTVIASIGPVTSNTLERHGLKASIEAREYTIDGLLKALTDYYKSVRKTA